jgi:polyisoprenoid-binding protein YceI
MRRFVLTLIGTFAIAASAAAQAGTWQIDPNHSAAQFSVRHLGVSTVRGAFTKVSGTVTYDPSNPANDVIKATIETASVDTRVDARDKDLRSPHFFDVDKYPTMTFESKQVKSVGAGKMQVTGNLTLHGVTKEVVLDVEGPSDPIKDPWGNQRMGASATTKISRKDFGVNGAEGAVGDEVTITLDVELIPAKK